MNMNKTGTHKKQIVIIIIWFATILVVSNCTWQLRSNQYRSYAEQSLKDVLLAGIIHISAIVNESVQTGSEMPLEQIAYQFYTIESTRRVLRNIYVENNPGEISTGPSVWMICGDAVSIMQNNEENYDYTFLVELSILFMDWAIEFEHSQGNMNFEYELGQLEDSVQVIVLPLMDFISP